MFCICVLIIAAAAVYMVEAYIHTYYAIEYMHGAPLVLNGNTVFASDDTSYWLQGAKVIGDDGHVYGHAETIRDALCLVLAKYGGLKGNSARQTKPIKAVRAW